MFIGVVLMDVLWATVAGMALGVTSGLLLAQLIWKIRGRQQSRELLDDFLGLGLIGVVYGLSILIGAWGFLAVFFAAVALHQAELKLANVDRHKQDMPISAYGVPGIESASAVDDNANDDAPAIVSEGALVFKEHLERLSEMILILLVGGMLFIDSWSWRAVDFALFLFLAARPVSVMLGLLGSGAPWRMRGMTGWFGVRGIGSLYYLIYAMQHGLPEPMALQFIQLTLVTIAMSVVVHGISVKPLMNIFWRRKRLP